MKKNYYDTWGVELEEPESVGFISMRVLEFLYGKPWDDVAFAFVTGLNPTYIRVTGGEIKCDARIGRVTVFVDDQNIIESIEKEVEVHLPEGVAHGEALGDALKFGLDSEQVEWHNDVESYHYSPWTGYSKMTSDGIWVPYPVD